MTEFSREPANSITFQGRTEGGKDIYRDGKWCGFIGQEILDNIKKYEESDEHKLAEARIWFGEDSDYYKGLLNKINNGRG